jgi:hypothetical protein
MANYAFGNRRQARPNASFYSNFMPALLPGDHNRYDGDPDMAFNQWLAFMNPNLSMRDDNQLRQLATRMHSDFNMRDVYYQDSRGGSPYRSFMDYLAKQNPEQMLQRSGPGARRQESRRFTSPARWITF